MPSSMAIDFIRTAMHVFYFPIEAGERRVLISSSSQGRLHSPRRNFDAARKIRTPAFMPVGTAATVKAMFLESVRASGTDVVLANTYHLMLRPGAERIAQLGGLHQFMR